MEEQTPPATPAATPSDAPKPEAAAPELDQKVEFGDFAKIQLRVAQILEAEPIAKSAKLVKLQIDLGAELGKRQIVAGVGKHYTPETLVGRKIVVVANLAPAKLMGETSNGMLLAATAAEGFLELVAVSPETPLGARVS